MKKHRSYLATVRKIAASSWGAKFDTSDEAQESLAKGKWDLTSAAVMELVRRLNQIIKALAEDEDEDEEDEADTGLRPDFARKHQGIQVGDLIYWCIEIDDVHRGLVTFVDEEGYACYVEETRFGQKRVSVCWMCDEVFRTPQEAVRYRAQEDAEYHGERLTRARAALESGEPQPEKDEQEETQ